MSKDLEREYRAFVNSEVPDLWARIEAGLEDKKTVAEAAETDLHITDFQAADSQMEIRRGKRVHFKAWGGLAAACVCMLLIIPAMTRAVEMAGGGSFSNSPPNYTAQDNSAPQAAEESCEKAEDARQESAYEAVNNAAAEENGMGSSVITSDDTAAGEEQESYSFHATVEILDTDVHMDSGILYTAKVIVSENPDIQVDSEIKIVSTAVEAALENSQTYDLILCEEHSDDSGLERAYILIDNMCAQ